MSYAMIAKMSGGPDVFEKQEVEPGKPERGEVLLRQTAIGLNFIDVYFRSGTYPVAGDFPAVLGSEGAGVVEAVGEDVEDISVGDRVAYTFPSGAYASHRTISADMVVKIPDSVSDEVAAASMLKGLTAQYLLYSCYEPEAGEYVLFHAGAGGVGTIAGQWLKAMGVNAIATAGGPEKCALAKENGYAYVIDYKKDDFVEAVIKITKGAGVSAVYDSVGKDTYPGSLKVLKKFGTFVSFGQSSGVVEDFKLADLAANGSLFATRPSLFHFIDTKESLRANAAHLFKMIESGHVKIAINQTFALEDVAKAHEALESRQTTGQTVLTVT